MGNPVVIIVAIAVFAVALLILNRVFASNKAKYTKKSLESISRETDFIMDATPAFIDDDIDRVSEAVREVPILGKLSVKLKRSGANIAFGPYLLMLLGFFVVVTLLASFVFKNALWIAPLIGLLFTIIFNNIFIGIKLEKRNTLFLNDFPDAIDMIVRSIRSGHPLLASLKLIATNSRPPLSTEFQRVVDEVAYGRPLSESLRKMADRIGILDVNFFVVILSVQQETGGSMAEVLSNLSTIIRKRKQLNLKIRALTSEGRLTTWIFSVIPFIQLSAVYFIAKNYLDPLFETTGGMICFAVAISMIALAIYISRQLCKMDI